jgi:hypothetical protein
MPNPSLKTLIETKPQLGYPIPHRAPIAQLDRVLPSEGKGHWFESSWVRHKINDLADILDA